MKEEMRQQEANVVERGKQKKTHTLNPETRDLMTELSHTQCVYYCVYI